MATKSKILIMNIMGWYARLDKDTLDLTIRFFMKGASTGDLNAYVKGVMKRELQDTPQVKTIEVVPEDSVPSTQR